MASTLGAPNALAANASSAGPSGHGAAGGGFTLATAASIGGATAASAGFTGSGVGATAASLLLHATSTTTIAITRLIAGEYTGMKVARTALGAHDQEPRCDRSALRRRVRCAEERAAGRAGA